MTVVSDDRYADELVHAHFELEPGITKIVRLVSNNEGHPNEPLKLLEVNTETLALGIRPVWFPARTEGNQWYPPVAIIEITPEEFENVKANPGLIPNNWQMTHEYDRHPVNG